MNADTLKDTTQFVVVHFPEKTGDDIPEPEIIECANIREVRGAVMERDRERVLTLTREEFIPRWEEFRDWKTITSVVSPE